MKEKISTIGFWYSKSMDINDYLSKLDILIRPFIIVERPDQNDTHYCVFVDVFTNESEISLIKFLNKNQIEFEVEFY